MAAELLLQNLSDLIGLIYDCTLDPDRWERTLDEIRSLLDCKVAQLALCDLRLQCLLVAKTLGMEPWRLEEQQKHAPEILYHTERVLDDGLSMDEPMITSRHISAAAIGASPYADFCRAQGIGDIAQINIVRSPTRTAALGLGRHEHAGVLTLDALKVGVVLADGNTRIVHANRAAEAMMRDRGPLRAVNGVMRAERTAASAELRAAVAAGARNQSGLGKTGLAVRLSEDHETPVIAHVLPLEGGEIRARLDPGAVAAVFINSPLEEASCARTISHTYKLTRAETRVLGPILAGKTVGEAAADVGVATTTARTHLNASFAKTGVSRQSELIRLAAAVAPATI